MESLSDTFGPEVIFTIMDIYVQLLLFLYVSIWETVVRGMFKDSSYAYMSGIIESSIIIGKFIYLCYRCDSSVKEVSTPIKRFNDFVLLVRNVFAALFIIIYSPDFTIAVRLLLFHPEAYFANQCTSRTRSALIGPFENLPQLTTIIITVSLSLIFGFCRASRTILLSVIHLKFLANMFFFLIISFSFI